MTAMRTATKLGLNILYLLAIILALHWGQRLIVPVMMSLVLAALLGPGAGWLHRTLKIRWSLSCLVVICGLLIVNILMTVVFGMTVSRIAQQIPTSEYDVKQFYAKIRGKIETASPWELDEVIFPKNPESVSEIRAYQMLLENVRPFLIDLAKAGGLSFGYWILILFTLLFLMLEAKQLSRRVIEIFGPSEETRSRVADALDDMAKQVRTYLVWRTIINFALAIVIGLTYQVAGLKQAWTWAILLAILNYIPYLGPLLAGVPPLIDALLNTSMSWVVFLFIAYWCIIILEGYLIVPVLMGRNMEMNATTVMLACMFWELIWGLPGLFLAMPIMAAVKTICYHVPGWRPWANLMSAAEDEVPPGAAGDKNEPPAILAGSSASLPTIPTIVPDEPPTSSKI
ncbi:MAG: AI-2E family transporter [Gemmataceae bacterium]|nr:AI-2E family transporter [Gemmataceae bacterium]